MRGTKGTEPVKKQCECCGSVFFTYKADKKYCSKRCYHTACDKEDVIKICPVCLGIFTLPGYRAKKRKYCSPECYRLKTREMYLIVHGK